MENKYDIKRFVDAHKYSFDDALAEIKNGRKESHWMWYIFPQILGLGLSPTSQYYAINNLEEARMFFDDEYLGMNLMEICEALLDLRTNDAEKVFGYPDNLKLKSSMTLFSIAIPEVSIFDKVLEKFYNGERDSATEEIIREIENE